MSWGGGEERGTLSLTMQACHHVANTWRPGGKREETSSVVRAVVLVPKIFTAITVCLLPQLSSLNT